MTYVSTPSSFNNFAADPATDYPSSRHYYGDYYRLTPTAVADAINDGSDSLWKTYIDSFFGSGTSATETMIQTDVNNPSVTASLYTILHTAGSWPPAALNIYNDAAFVEGMFAHLLRDFFYNYAPGHYANTDMDTAAEIRAKFAAYLNDPFRDSTTFKQNTILLWLWELLTQMLTEINEATLTEGGFLLAMTAAENSAATQLSTITYTAQANDQDYSTQAANMNLQTRADVYRAQRSANGKQGQMAQSMITTLRDAATQQAQLMTTIMQTMESMFQAIMKK